MAQRQFTSPMVLRDGKAVALKRLAFTDQAITESTLQQMLFEHPSLLPARDIEPIFGDLNPLARELPTGSGPIDLVYITPEGMLCLVETKLWRNPDARRSVVAQIIDYTKELARWSYVDLVEAVRKVRPDLPREADPLLAVLTPDDGEEEEEGGELDAAAFHDQVARNLRLGRFLLLIVGDGIREDVEHMVEYLQQTPQLGFTLALVELSLYRLRDDKAEPLLVQPRLIARTSEVVRAVVELKEGVSREDVSITVPKEPDPAKPGGRTPITEEEFFDQLLKNTKSNQVVETARNILNQAKDHDLTIEWGGGGPLLKYVDDSRNHSFTFGQLGRSGVLSCFGLLDRMCRRLALPTQIADDYFASLVKILEGTRRYDDPGKTRDGQAIIRPDVRCGPKRIKDRPRLKLLVGKESKWFAAIDEAVKRIQEALEQKEEG